MAGPRSGFSCRYPIMLRPPKKPSCDRRWRPPLERQPPPPPITHPCPAFFISARGPSCGASLAVTFGVRVAASPGANARALDAPPAASTTTRRRIWLSNNKRTSSRILAWKRPISSHLEQPPGQMIVPVLFCLLNSSNRASMKGHLRAKKPRSSLGGGDEPIFLRIYLINNEKLKVFKVF